MPRRKPTIEAIGQRFGRLTAIGVESLLSSDGRARNVMRVRCDCGTEKFVRLRNLRDGAVVSCGCAKLEQLTTHGMYGTPAHKSWTAMLARCRNPNAAGFDHYGGRGITVCEPWLSFANFYADMGARPKGHTLDRINPDGNYEPGNCRWATPSEQSRNQRPRRAFVSRRCVQCGELFMAKRSDARYCSPQHMELAHTARRRVARNGRLFG